MAEVPRTISVDDWQSFQLIDVVWELTLACDQKCGHCGSRAATKRPGELTTEECFDLVRQLAGLGVREVTLIGGEAYLRSDWVDIVAAIRAAGMACTLQTGGRNLTEERVRRAAAAGLQGVGVSIDGLRDVHDRLRGVPGSFDACFAALATARAHGMEISVNTTVTPPSVAQLRDLMELLIAAEVPGWQVGFAIAMGRAADNDELLLQPYELLDLVPLMAELWREGAVRGLTMIPGNTFGYYGPYETLFRGVGNERIHWLGCNAGVHGLGIESDGTIKGCPSLPRAPYAGGNIRDRSLEDLWHNSPEIGFNRTRTVDDLWGFCRTCYYADVCLAGCTWTSHSLLGRAGNNPYCHHRVIELAKQGLRERVVKVEPAPGIPFDHGRFDLLLEPLDGAGEAVVCAPPPDRSPAPPERLYQIRRRELPQRLRLCRGCNAHVKPEARTCPLCGVDLDAHERIYAEKMAKARAALERLDRARKSLRQDREED